MQLNQMRDILQVVSKLQTSFSLIKNLCGKYIELHNIPKTNFSQHTNQYPYNRAAEINPQFYPNPQQIHHTNSPNVMTYHANNLYKNEKSTQHQKRNTQNVKTTNQPQNTLQNSSISTLNQTKYIITKPFNDSSNPHFRSKQNLQSLKQTNTPNKLNVINGYKVGQSSNSPSGQISGPPNPNQAKNQLSSNQTARSIPNIPVRIDSKPNKLVPRQLNKVSVPESAYHVFLLKKKDQIKKEYPQLDNNELTQIMKEVWKSFDLNQKQPYELQWRRLKTVAKQSQINKPTPAQIAKTLRKDVK